MPSTRFHTTIAPERLRPAPADHSQEVRRAWRPADSSSSPGRSTLRPSTSPRSRNGVLRVHAGPVVASIGVPDSTLSENGGGGAPCGGPPPPHPPPQRSRPPARPRPRAGKPTRPAAPDPPPGFG